MGLEKVNTMMILALDMISSALAANDLGPVRSTPLLSSEKKVPAKTKSAAGSWDKLRKEMVGADGIQVAYMKNRQKYGGVSPDVIITSKSTPAESGTYKLQKAMKKQVHLNKKRHALKNLSDMLLDDCDLEYDAYTGRKDFNLPLQKQRVIRRSAPKVSKLLGARPDEIVRDAVTQGRLDRYKQAVANGAKVITQAPPSYEEACKMPSAKQSMSYGNDL